MVPHRGSQDDPARGDKKVSGSKKDDNQLKKWNQKLLLGEDIKQKETQMEPHRGSQDDPATGDKKIIFGVKSQILIKSIQTDP